MEKLRRYNVEGTEIEVPLRYDELSGKYLEEYPDFVECPVYTPNNAPIMFTGEDACSYAESSTEEPCVDCGSCRVLQAASEHFDRGVRPREEKKKSLK